MKGFNHTEESKEKMSLIKRGNKNALGHILSKESRRKISEAMKGRVCSEEQKQKISNSNTGRKVSEETKCKMSTAAKGRHLSEEHKRKMSETRRKIDRQFCPHGHDTHIVLRRGGRQGDLGGCAKCSYIRGAAVRKVPFDLTDTQFGEIIKEECIYKSSKCSPTGIDRIDSAKGYIVGNVQPMCGKHNQMKMDFGSDEFEILCTSVRSSRV